MSFQVTILKVLAGQPGGWLSLADVRRNVAILISSGRDWTDRTKRIAARAPGLNIFGQALVIRERGGWQITSEGRALLASIEIGNSQEHLEALKVGAPVLPAVHVPVKLIGINRRRHRRSNRSAREGRPVRAA